MRCIRLFTWTALWLKSDRISALSTNPSSWPFAY